MIHQLALEPLLTRSDLSLDKAFATLNMKKETNLNYGVQLLLQGKSLYFHEHVDSFCIFETALSLKRDIAEPDNEGIVRGPHTGFVEDLATNLASIRKLIKAQISSLNISHLVKRCTRKWQLLICKT